MRTILAAVLFAGAAAAQTTAAAQTYTLGTSSDPCTGGAALAIFQSTATARWSDVGFTCTFPVTVAGLYEVELDFLEPCFLAGACAGGQVASPGLRLQNIYVAGGQTVMAYDPVAAGATASVPARTMVFAESVNGNVSVRLQTARRSAVLSSVTITPYTPPPPNLSNVVLKPSLDSYALKSDLAQFVPYKGATSDVNLGSHGIFASVFDSLSAGASRLSFIKGPCPATADPGTDATLCMDVDGLVYKVSAAGIKTPIP